jgi:hypothetical protein
VTKETLQSKEPEWALPRDWKVEDDLKKDVANPTPLSQLKETIPVTAAN